MQTKKGAVRIVADAGSLTNVLRVILAARLWLRSWTLPGRFRVLGGFVRTRYYLPVIISLIFAVSFAANVFSQQTGAARQPASSVEGSTASKSSTSRAPVSAAVVKSDLSEALSVIQDNYIDGKKLDYNSIFKSSISGMLNVLDPHSTYFDPIEYASFKTEQRSEYFGIGATIGDLREGDDVNTYIRATFEEAPAYRAGLRFGDKIVAVDGQSMKGKTFPEVRKFLLGPRGTVVKVTVEHALTGKSETVTITRDAVPLPSIPQAYMIKPGVGYIAMTGGFNLTTSDEFQAALEDLHSKGMNMLLLDLRGNRGGLLIQAVRVANAFLQRDQLIVTQKGRIRGSSEPFRAVNDAPDQTPLVVLVNSETASAAEIVAGALQDHDRALIVGENTFGKGLVQLPIQLEYDSALLLTVAKYYTPSGRLIQRDYSNAGVYDYYTRGGIAATREPSLPTGAESHTDTGRAVYGGGGISPDEVVKPAKITAAEARLSDAIFAFALELTTGRVAGFENYKVQNGIQFAHDLQPNDYPVTDALFSKFKEFVTATPILKVTPEQLERARPFAERQLRYELTTAAYGTISALQVFNDSDPQIAKAVAAMPRARELALAARRARARS
ncbi:MAG TPA: S41 family peptidase [Pyrinomonadaceae bacterium]|nr:S41 family peptidase [Pyrinomonadaceae bacterium]